MEKMALVAPIPRARVNTAVSVKPGDLRNCRSEWRNSRSNNAIEASWRTPACCCRYTSLANRLRYERPCLQSNTLIATYRRLGACTESTIVVQNRTAYRKLL